MQLNDRMHIGSIVHRLSGTENQVLDVTLAMLQACYSMRTCSSVVAIVAATREAIFHGHSTSFVRPNADGPKNAGDDDDDDAGDDAGDDDGDNDATMVMMM